MASVQYPLATQALSTRPKPARLCYRFEEAGYCHFGVNCRYAHVTEPSLKPLNKPFVARHKPVARTESASKSSRTPSASIPEVSGPSGGSEGQANARRRLQPRRSPSRQPSVLPSNFFPSRSHLVVDPEGAIHYAIKQLVTPAGLDSIEELTDRHIPQAHKIRAKAELFKFQVVPLFRLITDKMVVNSASLQGNVWVLRDFLLGPGGSRMEGLFSFVTNCLQSWIALFIVDISEAKALEVCLLALSGMVDYGAVKIGCSVFRPIVLSLSSVLETPTNPDSPSSTVQATLHIASLKRRLDLDSNPNVDFAQTASLLAIEDGVGESSAEDSRDHYDAADLAELNSLPAARNGNDPMAMADYLLFAIRRKPDSVPVKVIGHGSNASGHGPTQPVLPSTGKGVHLQAQAQEPRDGSNILVMERLSNSELVYRACTEEEMRSIQDVVTICSSSAVPRPTDRARRLLNADGLGKPEATCCTKCGTMVSGEGPALVTGENMAEEVKTPIKLESLDDNVIKDWMDMMSKK